MAYVYVDLTSGNDTTGDGSAGTPYKTITKAAQVLASSFDNEIRVAGRQWTTTAEEYTFQTGTKTVTVEGNHAAEWAAGDRIRPHRSDIWGNPWVRVASASYSAGTGLTTLTLTHNYINESETDWTGTADHVLASDVTTMVSNNSLNSRNFTISGGWKLADESQPADYLTFVSGANIYRMFASGGLIIPDGSKFLLIAMNTVFYDTTFLVHGALEVQVSVTLDGRQGHIETLLVQSGTSYPTFYNGQNTSVGRMWVTLDVSAGGATQNLQGMSINELHLGSNAARTVYLAGKIGTLELHSDITVTPDSTNETKIEHVILNGHALTLGNPTTSSQPTSIGGPVGSAQVKAYGGVMDKTTGRGGTGYCLRMSPVARNYPCRSLPLYTLVEAGVTPGLTFYAYYSGTAADVPPCWIDVIAPGGVVAAKVAFTPINGASWDDATQQTVNFSGVTLQRGLFGLRFSCVDNVAGDAVLYLDDFAFTQS